MRDAIERASNISMSSTTISGHADAAPEPIPSVAAKINVKPEEVPNPVVVTPEIPVEKPVEKTSTQTPINNSIIELANNPDFSVATIAKEAKRIRKDDGEVFISLH